VEVAGVVAEVAEEAVVVVEVAGVVAEVAEEAVVVAEAVGRQGSSR
jgi:hypothetical protein